MALLASTKCRGTENAMPPFTLFRAEFLATKDKNRSTTLPPRLNPIK